MITACRLRIENSSSVSACSEKGRRWEALLRDHPQSGFMQSLHWAEFKRRRGQQVFQLFLYNQDDLIGGALLYGYSDGRRPGVLLCPYGPVLPYDKPDLATSGLRLILEEAEKIASRQNAISLRIEPRLEAPVPALFNEFAKAPVNLVPQDTLFLDLRQNDAELLAAMKAKCRYNIRLSQRHGVAVRELEGPDTVDLLYSMLEEASERDDFYLEPRAFFQDLIQSLMPAGVFKVFAAEHEGELLAVLALILYGKQAVYLYGGISNKKRHLMAGYAVQWEAIKCAKTNGCHSYDFYGYDRFQAPSHSYARFSRFKSGFGGRAVRFIGAQDHVFLDRVVDNVIGFFQDVNRSQC